ncbi:penicillin-binding protein 1C [Comamonas sp. NLF-1-9]|uniref:penicillin-binding protein 1C n=1 Tax=Comamonas sp. NLF-1-9 TaxID=2853163 RepID=UPI001C474F65|nr:penicillin-binding protein 1C [Comamonas sp. NLF-1-9]QXL84492.1 penicillin-binding protein 1C [Comamonas sp. NLF-1-9]
MKALRWRFLALALALALAAGWAGARTLPDFAAVRAQYRSSETLVLSREGEVLERLRTDPTVRRGAWQPLDEVSAALRHALVVSEDKRFYEHSGVDWAAVSAAAWANLLNRRTRGASTITMQLAGLLDTELGRPEGGRSLLTKAQQALAARELEQHWRKDQILEAYLNLVPLRGELVGIDALSRTHFGKAPHGLDARESALVAALVRAPNASASAVARRACGVLRAMQPEADCVALGFFVSAALQRRAFKPAAGVAPHFARQWLASQPAPGERTPLNARLQRHAQQSLRRHLRELAGRNVQDGALVVLDNASGEVLAWVGSSGGLSEAPEVDGVLALRQPGSTLKPFLYAQAIAERRLTAASLIHDAPTQIPTAGGLYIPQNYDRQFKGWVTVRTALASSLNVPAVRTLVMVTPDAFFRQLRAFGLPLRESGGYYGYSLALGASEVALLHLTNAYRALANGGRYTPASLRLGQTQAAPVQAVPEGAAFIVGDMLSDVQARVPTFGLDSVQGTRFWSAVKTGTSKDMRDNWAVGWSERYTVGVWVGNASGAAMHDVSGVSGAAPIWADLMRWLHRHEASRAPQAPAGLVRQPVRFVAASAEAAREEWFIDGTQQAVFAIKSGAEGADLASVNTRFDANSSRAAAQPRARILEPADGTILALDPDIPPAHQRLWLQAAGGQALAWRIDGQRVGSGERLAWLPWPGRHKVELLGKGGEVLDSIALEVRGAVLRAPAPAQRIDAALTQGRSQP